MDQAALDSVCSECEQPLTPMGLHPLEAELVLGRGGCAVLGSQECSTGLEGAGGASVRSFSSW